MRKKPKLGQVIGRPGRYAYRNREVSSLWRCLFRPGISFFND